MSTSDNSHPSNPEVAADAFAIAGGGLRAAEIVIVIAIGLLVCPPFLILAVVVAAPLIAISALVAAAIAAVAVPIVLVRRVRAHHRAHGSTLFLHRLKP